MPEEIYLRLTLSREIYSLKEKKEYERMYSYYFQVKSSVRQEGAFIATLFAVDMDVLISRLRKCGVDCRLLDVLDGCLI